MRRALLVLALGCLPASAAAQQGGVPPIVSAGLEAFRTQGVDQALDVWFRGWSSEDLAVARPQLKNGMSSMVEKAGPVRVYEYAGVVRWGERTMRVYAVILCDKQAVFARFDLFRPADTWKVLSINFHTDVKEIFPDAMLAPAPVAPPRSSS